MMNRLLHTLFFLVLFSGLSAQVRIIPVNPASTGSGIQTIHGDHFAFVSRSAPSKHRLLFMIGGTGASARDFLSFDSTIAALGYHVISIDYSNNVITTTCSDSRDSGCFNDFRQEIVFCNKTRQTRGYGRWMMSQ